MLSIMAQIPKILVEFKWKGPSQFLLTRIFRIASGGGPYVSVGQLKFAVPFLANQIFALIREFSK